MAVYHSIINIVIGVGAGIIVLGIIGFKLYQMWLDMKKTKR